MKQFDAKKLLHLLLITVAVLMNLPFIWMISTAFKAPDEVFSIPPKWIPDQLMWENFSRMWHAAPFDIYLLNSLIVSVIGATGTTIIGALAAFGFAKLEFKGKNIIFFLFLMTTMIPLEVRVIPNYIIVKSFGWLDTFEALIIPGLASAFAIFLLRQFFLGIPRDLDDAATIDGCSRLRYLFTIILPLSKPALLTVWLFMFIRRWNSLLWPLVVTNRDEMRVVQVGLASFQDHFGVEWGELMAASTLVAIPIMIVFLFVQKHFIEGVARVGIKG